MRSNRRTLKREQRAAWSSSLPFEPSVNKQCGHDSTRPRGEARQPPGTCPRSLITGSQRAVSSLMGSPWGVGTAEVTEYSEEALLFLRTSRTWHLTPHPSRSSGGLLWAEEAAHGSSLNPITSLHPHCRCHVRPLSSQPGPQRAASPLVRALLSRQRDLFQRSLRSPA